MYNEQERVYIDSIWSTTRRLYWMKDIVMSEDEVNLSIPFQALTGNAYVSSFFQKENCNVGRR